MLHFLFGHLSDAPLHASWAEVHELSINQVEINSFWGFTTKLLKQALTGIIESHEMSNKWKQNNK